MPVRQLHPAQLIDQGELAGCPLRPELHLRRHLHPRQTERFTVLAGSLEVCRGDESFTAGAGDEFTVEPGVAHQMRAGGEGAVFRWRTSPALRTGELYCSTWECARDNRWAPTGLQVFEVVKKFGDEFRLA